MTLYFKKYLLLTCIITASGALFAMEDQNHKDQADKDTPHAAKYKKMDQSVSCAIEGKPTKLTGAGSSSCSLAGSTVTPPAIKCPGVDVPPRVPAESVEIVFSQPALLAKILQYLDGPDICRFARTSKVYAAAMQSDHMRNITVAKALQRQTTVPIRFLPAKARGAESVNLFGIACKTNALLQCLREKSSLLDEYFGSLGTTCLPTKDRGRMPLPKAVTNLSPEELFVLKPIKYLAISCDTEDKAVEQVANIAAKFSDHTIALNLSESDQVFYDGDITESLINKLAQYPIIFLHCELQKFPDGLACLSSLHELRALSIVNCTIGDDNETSSEGSDDETWKDTTSREASIPDKLCTGLPFLTILRINDCRITSLSPEIDKLRHLAILDLSDNELDELPSTLGNLPRLKVLLLNQVYRLPHEQLVNTLPPTACLKQLALSHQGKQSPLPENCSLEQLRSLTLNGNLESLQSHSQQLKNLQKLTILGMTDLKLPSRVAHLPALKQLQADLWENHIIAYDDLLRITRLVDHCSLFIMHTDKTIQLKKAVDLWQLIRINNNLIRDKLDALNTVFSHNRFAEISTIFLLMQPAITGPLLLDLITAKDKILAPIIFVRELLRCHCVITGLAESAVINKQFRPHDQNFAVTIQKIARMICQNIPIYGTTGRYSKNRPQLSNDVVAILQSLATTLDKRMRMIEQGEVISPEQFNKCIARLKLWVVADESIVKCSRLIANLFFHHAIAHNDTTTAAIMFKHGADINFVYEPDYDTPLHCAIKNRMLSDDKNLQDQIDSVIYFLIQNGADLELTNRQRKTPIELIPSNSELYNKIEAWRPR